MTSGRCRCNNANSECPTGQDCRTFTPYNNRCTPTVGPSACAAGESVDALAACPDYCHY
jgi:hypothetical protein